MTDIAAANVTAAIIHQLTLPNMPGEVKRVNKPELRLVMGTISIATNFDYDTTVMIPLDNLFDSTKSSYTYLKEATCRTLYMSRLNGGTFFNKLIPSWSTKKIKVLALPATPAENEAEDELADGTALGAGTMTIEFAVVGEVVGT